MVYFIGQTCRFDVQFLHDYWVYSCPVCAVCMSMYLALRYALPCSYSWDSRLAHFSQYIRNLAFIVEMSFFVHVLKHLMNNILKSLLFQKAGKEM